MEININVTTRRLAAVKVLKEHASTPMGVNLLSLLDLRIEEVRRLNDVSSLTEVRLNQGKIEELKCLKNWIFDLR